MTEFAGKPVHVVLDEKEHRYSIGSRPLIGVTEIFAGLCLRDVSNFTQFHRDRGKAVHAAVAFWLQGALKWSSVDPQIIGRVRAAIRFIEENDFKVRHAERLVYDADLGVAGTLDLDGERKGVPTLVDWKSGAVDPVTGLQLAGYERLLKPQYSPYRRMGVELRDDGTYKKTDFDSHRDERRFLAALDLFRTFVWKGDRHAVPSGPSAA